VGTAVLVLDALTGSVINAQTDGMKFNGWVLGFQHVPRATCAGFDGGFILRQNNLEQLREIPAAHNGGDNGQYSGRAWGG
jgi:hypothetical protein